MPIWAKCPGPHNCSQDVASMVEKMNLVHPEIPQNGDRQPRNQTEHRSKHKDQETASHQSPNTPTQFPPAVEGRRARVSHLAEACDAALCFAPRAIGGLRLHSAGLPRQLGRLAAVSANVAACQARFAGARRRRRRAPTWPMRRTLLPSMKTATSILLEMPYLMMFT